MESTPRLYDTLVDVLHQHQKWLDLRHLKTLAWMTVGVVACEQGTSGLQIWADVGQRYVQTNDPSSQRLWQMSQHSCAKGLQIRLRANTCCEWHNGHEINAFIGTPCSAAV
jgi:hypothetical protein